MRPMLGTGRGWPVLLLALFACGEDPMSSSHDVDLAALFAPATAAEVEAVRSEWAQRDVEPDDVQEEGTEAFPLGTEGPRCASCRTRFPPAAITAQSWLQIMRPRAAFR